MLTTDICHGIWNEVMSHKNKIMNKKIFLILVTFFAVISVYAQEKIYTKWKFKR